VKLVMPRSGPLPCSSSSSGRHLRGDVAVWFGELDEPHTEGQLLVCALEPELVWLAHEHEPWRPRAA
jgi:hypothetical protein